MNPSFYADPSSENYIHGWPCMFNVQYPRKPENKKGGIWGRSCVLEERDSKVEVKWKQRGAHVVCGADVDTPPPGLALSFQCEFQEPNFHTGLQNKCLPTEPSHYPDLVFLGNSDSNIIILADIFLLNWSPSWDVFLDVLTFCLPVSQTRQPAMYFRSTAPVLLIHKSQPCFSVTRARRALRRYIC